MCACRTQEIIILYWVAGGLVMMGGKLGTGADLFGGPFGVLIWDQYLIQSPQADGLDQYIPGWVVPPRGTEALLDRTFLHQAWIEPIAILLLAVVLQRINALSLGYVLFRITHDIERLPFPMAYVQAGGATALAETSSKQEGWRWHVFSTGTFIGSVWGGIYVVVPTLSSVFLTDTVSILPIPFADITVPLKAVLPAAVLGLATDLFHLLVGMVLPFWVVVGSFASSILVNVVANPILYTAGILHTWSPGMSAIPTMISNSFDFWLSFSIGGAIVVAVVGFWTAGPGHAQGRPGTADAGGGAVPGAWGYPHRDGAGHLDPQPPRGSWSWCIGSYLIFQCGSHFSSGSCGLLSIPISAPA